MSLAKSAPVVTVARPSGYGGARFSGVGGGSAGLVTVQPLRRKARHGRERAHTATEKERSLPKENYLTPVLLTAIVALLGYFGIVMKGDLDKVVDAERATSDAVKNLQIEVVKEASGVNRRLDAVVVRLDGIGRTLAERP